ncbi:MAG: hypothetical protein AAB899_04950, partial [Patescibacteria group bacterium]
TRQRECKKHKSFGFVRRSGKGGFTLLLAALISSVVLALGVSIFEIAQKQVSLSSIGRESQFAFYAADTAAECALYWDVRWNYFAQTPPFDSATCDNQPVAITLPRPSTPTRTMSFNFNPNGFCSKVTVKKCDIDVCDSYQNTHTIIRADGYNVPCASIDSSTRALQRSVELRY